MRLHRFFPHIPLESSRKRSIFVRMNLNLIVRIMNTAIRAMFILIGIFLIVGLFRLRNVPTHFRILMGVVFVLYGIFRIVTLFMKKKEDGERE